MRLLVANLTGGGLSGGYRTYLRELLPRLASVAEVRTLEVVMPPGTVAAAGELAGSAIEWPADPPGGLTRWLAARVQARDIDVVFVPTARVPSLAVPVVAMVRNMEPLVRPLAGNSVSDGVRNLGRLMAAHHAVRRASRVIAVSDFVRDFLVDRWHVSPERVGVVPHGVAMAGESVPPPGMGDADDGCFLFTAGSIRPARGLEDVIGAMEALGADAPPLVIAGTVDAGAERYASAMCDRLARAGLTDRVRWAGHLNRAQMRWCFEQAAAFVMTSRVEACPNIALEAMCHGAVSIATRCRPMPEFFGPAASYYDAGASSALAGAIREVLAQDAARCATRRKTARARAAGYSWDATARGTITELAHAMR